MVPGGAFDAVVVGASIGGCTAARLFALEGARVALLEQRPDPDAYKVVCTHQILSSAVPTMDRLGLTPLIEKRGAIRSYPAAWTPSSGWIEFPEDVPHGYGVTRRTLDPLLRELAAGTPGVELMVGRSVTGLLNDGGRPAGVEVADAKGGTERIGARLVVAADGRGSTVARLARVPGRVRPHNRFFYFAYWRGLRPATNRARVWFLDPEGAAAFPNEDDLTVLVAVPHRSRMAEFRADPEASYADWIAGLPDAPEVGSAERVSKLIGKLETPNVMRPAARPGLAFVGDAALASDPVFGVGCGWAFQSAEWLVDRTHRALFGGDRPALDRGLDQYRRSFRRRLGPHHWAIADLSTGRELRAMERMTFRAAATDEPVARAVEALATRRRSAFSAFDPRLVGRVAASEARRVLPGLAVAPPSVTSGGA